MNVVFARPPCQGFVPAPGHSHDVVRFGKSAAMKMILRDETPLCALERVRLDLSATSARCELFRRLAG